MILEETSSGNLRIFPPAKREAAVRITRADVRAIADVFALLDSWAGAARETAAAIDDEPSQA